MSSQPQANLAADGFCRIDNAIDQTTVDELISSCEAAFADDHDQQRARSSRGHVYAARNLLDTVPRLRSFWQSGPIGQLLQMQLGSGFGLVRVLYFDKPPDRTWSLPWHKDTAIAVKDNSTPSNDFSRPTVKAGVPHVIACDEILQRMLTIRIHLDDVSDNNGPLQVIPGSHTSRTSEGVGVDGAVTIYASAGDTLVMRPLISHCSSASTPGTVEHRRILHLEFSSDPLLADGYQWHDFWGASEA